MGRGTAARKMASGSSLRGGGPTPPTVASPQWRNVMLNSKTLDDLAARIGKAFEGSPAKDIEKNVKAMLSSGLSRLDLVPRAEFDVQAQVLLKTREKLEALERRLAELEARVPPRDSAR
jgi:BMFP domain-containing protein YqiC